jgi:hypothetical protein
MSASREDSSSLTNSENKKMRTMSKLTGKNIREDMSSTP